MYVSDAIFFAKFLLVQLNRLSSLSLAEDGSSVAVQDTVVLVELAGCLLTPGEAEGCWWKL